MSIEPAAFERPGDTGRSGPFVPTGAYRGDLQEHDYVEEEWFARGEVDGLPYATSVFVRRPRDPARFSGTVVVEPLHAASAAPVWIFTSTYHLRAGNGWACVASQKTALDDHVKPFDPARYAGLDIGTDAPPMEPHGLALPRDPDARRRRMEQMQQVNAASTPILAQVGAALAAGEGPFEGFGVRHVVLAGHSQTGGVVTDYVVNGHDAHRHADGSPVYHGFFPAGAPSVTFGPRDVPIVQVVSDGDVASRTGPWREGRGYRRPDSDEPGDRYRLYELAGVAHMGTRYPPYSDNAMWQADPTGTAGNVPKDATMNSLPHSELFHMGLHHLLAWVDRGSTPPRAARIEVGPDDLFAKDEHGNTVGGVRCPQLDVPRARYHSNSDVADDGSPVFGVVGLEEPLPRETLRSLYRDHDDYVGRFNRRVDELIGEGWLLAEDADGLRAEAASADVP